MPKGVVFVLPIPIITRCVVFTPNLLLSCGAAKFAQKGLAARALSTFQFNIGELVLTLCDGV